MERAPAAANIAATTSSEASRCPPRQGERAITGTGKDFVAKGFVLPLAGIPAYVGTMGWQKRQALREAGLLASPIAGSRSRSGQPDSTGGIAVTHMEADR